MITENHFQELQQKSLLFVIMKKTRNVKVFLRLDDKFILTVRGFMNTLDGITSNIVIWKI